MRRCTLHLLAAPSSRANYNTPESEVLRVSYTCPIVKRRLEKLGLNLGSNATTVSSNGIHLYTTQAVKDAYRDQCKVMHPDCGGTESGFREVSQAYQALMDQHRKELLSGSKIRLREAEEEEAAAASRWSRSQHNMSNRSNSSKGHGSNDTNSRRRSKQEDNYHRATTTANRQYPRPGWYPSASSSHSQPSSSTKYAGGNPKTQNERTRKTPLKTSRPTVNSYTFTGVWEECKTRRSSFKARKEARAAARKAHEAASLRQNPRYPPQRDSRDAGIVVGIWCAMVGFVCFLWSSHLVVPDACRMGNSRHAYEEDPRCCGRVPRAGFPSPVAGPPIPRPSSVETVVHQQLRQYRETSRVW